MNFAFKKAYRECRLLAKTTPLNIIHVLVFDYLLSKGKTKILKKYLYWIKPGKNPLLRYYAAQVEFLFGHYPTSTLILKQLNLQYPSHADISYLLSENYRLEGNKGLAIEVLEETLKNSRRLKTWLLIANLTENNEDHQKLKSLWKEYRKKEIIPSYHYELDSYISTSAMRSKNYEDAIELWKSFIRKTVNNEATFPSNTSQKKFTSDNASKALIDLNTIFSTAGIDFFLVSGTLLGCIRENKLLGHDKDIDVGVWSDIQTDKIITHVKKSGLFYILASRSDLALRIKHVNGTAIDIFLHFREDDNYWHGGSKLKWNNTPFTLIKHNFLGRNFLIPAEYDLYLTENYGDWKTEKSNFDSAFDTPNATILNHYELIVHAYKQLAKSIYVNNPSKIDTHIDTLKKLGEKDFYLE